MPNSIKRLILGFSSLMLLLPATASAAVHDSATSAAVAGIQYLANNQQADGSISGFGGESEWAVEAVLAAGQDPATFAHNGSVSLLDFVDSDAPSSSATAIERNMIAVAVAGQDVTNVGGTDYESLLAAQSNNSQVGDTTLLNDDMFALIAINAAHDTTLLSEAQDALDYLIANQGADGVDTGFGYSNDCSSWCYSDSSDTAAAIIAFKAAENLGLTNPGLATAETNATSYMLSTQQSDGGFAGDNSGFSPSDGDSTAWALIALNMLGSTYATQADEARIWLINNQNSDGGFSYGAYGFTSSDSYTTAHAIIALLGTSWTLNPTPTPIPTAPTGGQGGGSTPTPIPTTVTTTSAAPAKPKAHTQTSSSEDVTIPQVKAAETFKQLLSDKPATTLPKSLKTKSGGGLVGYVIALLAIVAILWFVLESRTDKGGKNA